MAALAERRIIPHEELKARAEEKSEAEAAPGASAAAGGAAVRRRRAARREDAGQRGCPRTSTSRRASARCRPNTRTRGVNLVRIASKWTFRTAGDLSWLLTKEAIVPKKLSRAAIETLAVIAYHQPVTRAEVEEIRGVVMSKGTFDVLMETGWIKPRGRRKVPGRPITYGTTEDFLSHFGLEATGRPAGTRGAEGLGTARQPSAAGLRGADAVRRSGAARRRGPARAGRSRSRPRAAAGAHRGIGRRPRPRSSRAGKLRRSELTCGLERARAFSGPDDARCEVPGIRSFERLSHMRAQRPFLFLPPLARRFGPNRGAASAARCGGFFDGFVEYLALDRGDRRGPAAVRTRQDFRADGRRRPGHQGLQEGHVRRRDRQDRHPVDPKIITETKPADPLKQHAQTERKFEA